MLLVGESIDGRDAGERGEGLDVGLLKGTNHSPMDHASEHTGRILDRLTPSELDFARREEEGIAAEFPDSDLEADPCPGR